MKKQYNKDTLTDAPIDSSFSAAQTSKAATTSKTTPKAKINTIGKTTTVKAKTISKRSTKSSAGTKSASESKAKTTKSTHDKAKNKDLRTKLTNSKSEIDDLEKLNEDNIKTFRFKSKRNKVLIAVLSMILVVSIAVIVTFAVISKLKTNCNFYVRGAKAVYIIDDQELSEFRAPSNLQGNRVLKLDIELKIKEGGSFNIKFHAEAFQKGVKLKNTLIYNHNPELFYDGYDGYWYSKAPIGGNQTIDLCEGVILDYNYENSLNVDNFKLEFYTYLEKV